MLAPPIPAAAQEGDPAVLAMMRDLNARLRAAGVGLAVEQIDFFTIGVGRPSTRLHQTGTRWVAFDPRRDAQDDAITYVVDQSSGATKSGLSSAQTEAAIDRALTTWHTRESCLRAVDLIKRTDPGVDLTIFDEFFPGFDDDPATGGNPFVADIVEAGWRPGAFFEAVGGPLSDRNTLAFTITFIFVDEDGNPSDINRDRYFDTALAETYYNDSFGDPASDLAGYPWAINQPLPSVDVESAALHETGHALELGHFGPPPAAVMNPVYAGIKQLPLPIDHAGMCAVWSAWPK